MLKFGESQRWQSFPDRVACTRPQNRVVARIRSEVRGPGSSCGRRRRAHWN